MSWQGLRGQRALISEDIDNLTSLIQERKHKPWISLRQAEELPCKKNSWKQPEAWTFDSITSHPIAIFDKP